MGYVRLPGKGTLPKTEFRENLRVVENKINLKIGSQVVNVSSNIDEYLHE